MPVPLMERLEEGVSQVSAPPEKSQKRMRSAPGSESEVPVPPRVSERYCSAAIELELSQYADAALQRAERLALRLTSDIARATIRYFLQSALVERLGEHGGDQSNLWVRQMQYFPRSSNPPKILIGERARYALAILGYFGS